MSKTGTISKYTAVAIEQTTGVRDELYGVGVPDYFLWESDGRYRFIEVKASEDKLNPNQRGWARNYECNFYIVQLAPVSEDFEDEELIKRFRIT